MGIKHHLQRLAGIGNHRALKTVAQPKMRHLGHLHHPVEHHPFVAPVKLVCFPRGKGQWNKACPGMPPLLLPSLLHKTLDAVVAADIAFVPE